MSDAVYIAGILVRFVHLGSACLLTGIFAFLVFVARPAIKAGGSGALDSFRRLDEWLLSLAAVVLGLTIGTGLLDLARQALVAGAGSGSSGLTFQTLGALLGDTRYGDVWMARHALWILLAALLLLRWRECDAADWLALRLAGLVLAGAALAVGAASSHAASAPEPILPAIGADALHLLAVGMWAGALVPLWLFLRWASPGNPGGPPPVVAAVAVRRFSALGVASMTAIVASGIYAIPQQVGSIPALLGTTYGRWLLLKLALLLTLLAVAFVNFRYLRPSLERASAEARDGQTNSRSAAGAIVERLRRSVLAETVLVVGILGAVAVLGLTAPARHDPISWPLPFRLSWETAERLPEGWLRALALPPLAVDAYPTTYTRPMVPYTASSIVRGSAIYRKECESCHGTEGGGVGAGPSTRAESAGDLNTKRVLDHTAGDLFWWISRGVRGSPMRGFEHSLSVEQRWDLVNLLRTFSSVQAARRLGPTITRNATIVAPDFAYTVGVGAPHWLRDYRGQTIVLLVFFRLPEARERLSRLADAYFEFRMLGAEILAVPLEHADMVYKALGAQPLLFPFAIGGAPDAVAVYRLFGDTGRGADPWPHHMEFVVDRQGYLRGRWIPTTGSPDATSGWGNLRAFLDQLVLLAREPITASVVGEHIH
jgi:putative copper export protein/mono/diheme cytochrome c family protein/peroxiredoxin